MAIKKTAIINGTPYLNPVGVNSGKSLGNTTKLSVAAAVTKKTIPNMQGGGGNDDSFEKLESLTLSMSCRHVSIATLELALGGTAVAVAAGAVADEPHEVIELDTLIAFNHMQDMSQTLTVEPSAGGAAFIEGTDYLRKRAGIIPVTGGAIAAAADLLISYTKAAHQRIQALLSTVTERGLLFDGINERTNKPWSYKFHRVAWGVAKTIEIIGEEFVSFDIEGEGLAWDGITETGKSQFYEVLVGDAL